MLEAIKGYRFFLVKAVSTALAVSILVFFASWAAEAQAHDEAVAAQIAEAERAANRGPYATDGVFTGSAQGYGGPVQMQVTISDGWIENVAILDASYEDQAWLDMAIVLPDLIVRAQSTNVDVVSGATFTSAGILNGTTAALLQSVQGDA